MLGESLWLGGGTQPTISTGAAVFAVVLVWAKVKTGIATKGETYNGRRYG
jgi:hypothetical protein